MITRIAVVALVCTVACSVALAQDKPERFTDGQWVFMQKLIAEQDAGARQTLIAEDRPLVTENLIDACVAVSEQWGDSANVKGALALMERAEEMALALGSKVKQASVCWNRGRIYFYNASDNEAARRCYDMALALYREAGDKLGEANCYAMQGDLYLRTGENERALEMWGNALPLYREVGDKRGEANCYWSQGNLYSYTDENERALEMWGKALPLYREVGDKRGEANCYAMQGDLYLRTGENERALEMWGDALPLYREVGDKLGEAHCYKSQGNLYFHTGENERALEMWGNALPLYLEVGSKLGEANCYKSQGDLYLRTGENERALEMWGKALPLYREVGDKLGEAHCYKSQGNLYFRIGGNERALEMWDKALPLYLELGHRLGEANCYWSQGNLYFRMGENERALEMWGKALPLYQELGHRLGEAHCYKSQGNLYFHTGENERALEMWGKALPLYEELGDKLGGANCYESEGDLYFHTGENEQALAALTQAAALNRAIGQSHNLRLVDITLGRARESMGDFAGADAAYKESMELAESLVRMAGSEMMAASYGGEVLDSHVGYAGFLARRDRAGESYGVAERGKGRALVELLGGSGKRLSQAMTPEEEQEETRLSGALSSASARLSEAAGSGAEQAKIDTLRQKVETARSELRQFQEAVYLRHPELRTKRGEMKPLDWESAKALLSPGDAVLEYVVGDDFVVIYAGCHPEGSEPKLTVKHVEWEQGELERLVGLLRGAVADPRRTPDAAAKFLYAELVEPVQEELKGCKRLLICPDGVLYELPFQALMTPEGKCLLQEYEISYAPSITAWNEMTKAARSHPAGLEDGAMVLAVGVSDFGERGWKESLSARQMIRKFYSTERVASESAPEPDKELAKAMAGPEPILSSARGTFAQKGALVPLPSVPRELRALSDLLGPTCEVALGSAAQESAVKEKMPNYRILHFASHGLLDQRQPFSSAIALADPKADPELEEGEEPTEDGFLEAREILGMQLNANLAVLSCCQTALGRRYRGEGIVGLSWAFFAAGCPSVVASQWVVDDESTAVLMEEFYMGLLAGKGKAAALRDAQLKLLASRGYSHPFHWAPFILIGSRE